MTPTVPDIWRDVTRRVGFYTKETMDQIPEASGCYAWMIPLWIYNDDLEVFLSTVNRLLVFDSGNENVAERTVRADFSWESIDTTLRKRHKVTMSQAKRRDWAKAMADARVREGFQHVLMEATLFMPPLYVGKADNLRDRYLQHTAGSDRETNTFHRRFTRFVTESRLTLSVSDLLFVCIETPPELAKVFHKEGFNELLEQVLMRLCRPSFSIR